MGNKCGCKLMSLFPNITCVSKSREIGSFIML
nr:MAG TPA: hypothetical protein [Caudoviricetes sp.]